MKKNNKTTYKYSIKPKPQLFNMLIGLLLLSFIISFVPNKSTYNLYSNLTTVPIDDDNEALEITDASAQLGKEKGKKNILFIGSDEGTVDTHGRSDSMILITIDRDNKKIKATSFMRDMLVTIPDFGEHNLNHAYAYGGAELLVKTFNYNFGLDIKDYVKVDFKTFIKIIDKLGGIDIDIQSNEVQVTNTYIRSINKFNKSSSSELSGAGLQTLNGVQALAYSRNRFVGSDYGRTNRQRKVLQAITTKFSHIDYVEIVKFLVDVLPEVTTTLNIAEISDLTAWAVINRVNTLQGTYLPKLEESQHIKTDEYHIVVNKEAFKKEVQNYIFYDR
ncbi:transcriptional attenuator, LytR family [Clostridium cavendishii DSM 21758]|uniref:Transcriptional attenuator, LytR family n=1 Tax=Clostridium cavendishii DSM 21758 TaxID=1121302 RepID=A0A1M6GFJ9_9CLOT|nr:LCP family protein [Clostridium cavendishii]SHJ08746.1 transcriptional attenuator, LytR family [Clostridium cavendishii DSM 21758]